MLINADLISEYPLNPSHPPSIYKLYCFEAGCVDCG